MKCEAFLTSCLFRFRATSHREYMFHYTDCSVSQRNVLLSLVLMEFNQFVNGKNIEQSCRN